MTKEQIRQSLSDYQIFLRHCELSERSVKKYVRDITRLLAFDGEIVDKEWVIAYKKDLQAHCQPATVNSYIISLNKFFRWCGQNALAVKTVQVPRALNLENIITESEYRLLLGHAQEAGKEKLALIMKTLAGTGIRVGELRFISRDTVERGRTTIFSKGRYREIMLPDRLRHELEEYCLRRNIPGGPVFYGRTPGKPMATSGIWSCLKRHAEASGVDPAKVYPHSFRHLFAKTYMERLGNIAELADLLGHASIETTRIYTGTSSAEKKRSLNLLDL